MSAMLVIARDDQPGDALCALPTICALAAQRDVLYLAMTCEPIRAMADFPGNVLDVLHIEPHWRNRSMPTQVLGVAASIGYKFSPSVLHPIHSLMAFAGLDVDRAVLPSPRIRVSAEPAPNYDVVLCPWAKAPERSMSGHQIRALCAELHAAGLKVALVGGPGQASQDVDFPRSHTVARAFFGAPFPAVVGIMRGARCVVTVDSFPNRLAHAAGVKRHLILDSKATPWQWQAHPGAVRVQGGRRGPQAEWEIPAILEAIERSLDVEPSTSSQPA